jgi:hypothetical protein
VPDGPFSIRLRLPAGEVKDIPARIGVNDVASPPGLRERYRLEMEVPGLGSCTYRAQDHFECLLDLRRELEPRGYGVLVQGSRRNVWPSGMQRDMGVGSHAYELELGKHGVRPPVVAIFDPADEREVVTIEEQFAYRDAWFAEIRDHGTPG